jgi:hypothetical protein
MLLIRTMKLRGISVVAAGLAISVVACDWLGRTCTLIGCNSVASARINLLPRQGTLPGSRLTACRDSLCRSAPFPVEPEVNMFAPMIFEGPEVTGTLLREPDGTRRLDLSFPQEEGLRPQDGQRFSIKLMDSEGTTVLAERVVTFQKFAPNGEECGPTCWHGEIAP